MSTRRHFHTSTLVGAATRTGLGLACADEVAYSRVVEVLTSHVALALGTRTATYWCADGVRGAADDGHTVHHGGVVLGGGGLTLELAPNAREHHNSFVRECLRTGISSTELTNTNYSTT